MAGMLKGFKGLVMPASFNMQASASIPIGHPYYIPYSISPDNTTNKKVRWSSSNNSIATVDDEGIITPIAVGDCTITGILDCNGLTNTLSLTTYQIPVTGITLNQSSIEVEAGEPFQLTATITPTDASNKDVIWSSSNTSVAVVDSNGLVTYVADGTATITATSVDGGLTATCTVTCDNMSGYTKCEYIEGTGTQYINTLYTPTVNTEIEANISWGSSQVEWAVFWGVTSADKSSDGILGRIYYSSSTGATNIFNPRFCNATYGECQKTVTYNEFHEIVMKKNYCSVDGTQVSSLTTTGTPYQAPIFIFCGNNGGSAWRYGKCKIAGFVIKESGVKQREFVPVVRNSDKAVGLYDKVNKVFYENKGSGSFVHGPEVVNLNQVQEVEYIQSSGTQYFKLGNQFKTSYKSVIDFQMDTIGGDYIPLGMRNTAGTRYGLDVWNGYFTVISGGNDWTNLRAEDKNRHTITIDKNTATFDGTNYSIQYTNYTFNFGIGVFCYLKDGSTVGNIASCKLYKLDIYDENGIHIYDLVPCYVKTTGCIGLYDKVNNKFYHNEGTGTFIAGPKIGISLNKNKIAFRTAGDTSQLTVTANPSSIGDDGYTWSSSDTSIATVEPITARLPSAYQEVEYIQSSGTQRISTGVTASTSIKASVDFEITSSSASDQAIIGYYNNETAVSYRCGYGQNNGFTLSGGVSVLTRQTGTGSNITENASNYTLQLFCKQRYSDGRCDSFATAKLYGCNIWNNGTLIRNFVPCYRKSDSVIGLYDLVNDQFYTNIGTGTFTKGQDIIESGVTVTCIEPGECVITVETTDNIYRDICQVSVLTTQEYIYNFDDGTWTNAKLDEDGWVNGSYGLNASSGGLVFADTSTDRGGSRTKTFTINDGRTTLTFYFKGVKSDSWGGTRGSLGTVSGSTYTNLVSINSNYNDNKNGLRLNNSWAQSVGYNASVEGTFTYNRTTGARTSIVNGNTATGTTSLNFTENLYMSVTLSKGYYSAPSYIYKIKAVFE